MFTFDPRLRGLPASREQVVALYQSINSPHVVVPGKPAGPAQAYVLGIRGTNGMSVFAYLYLADAKDCAVYVPKRRNLTPEDYATEEANAVGFVESMGFMMDNMNFRALSPADRDSLIKALPVFQREPGTPATAAAKVAADAKPAGLAALGRLFGSF